MTTEFDQHGVDYAGQLLLNFRRHYLIRDLGGHNIWREENIPRTIPADQTAIIICDMWDKHWSRGASERVNKMVAYMNEVIHAARDRGVLIIHAPSDTMEFYAGTPAQRRIELAPEMKPPAEGNRPEPPLPIDDADDGSDTGELEPYKAWSRQHPEIDIDQEVDGISDDGRAIYSFLQQQGIRQLLIMGVHTNMCVLNRSFGIKQMVKWGMNIALVRDLTDTMYNPANAPYVSHEEGTRLVIGYIERFWCPSIASADLLA